MALCVCAMMNTNGNGGVIFYSATIFEQVNFPSRYGIIIILFFYVAGSLPGICLLKVFGRRTI